MTQPFLFNPSNPPFQSHSVTSRQAAESVASRTAEMRRVVLSYMTSRGELGATDQELAEALGLPPEGCRVRRIELTAAGSLRDSGATRPTARPTRSRRGRPLSGIRTATGPNVRRGGTIGIAPGR